MTIQKVKLGKIYHLLQKVRLVGTNHVHVGQEKNINTVVVLYDKIKKDIKATVIKRDIKNNFLFDFII